MKRDRDEDAVADLMLERFRLGELPEGETERLRERLRDDDALRRRLETLDRSDREIHRRYPPEWLASAARSRFAARSRTRPRRERRHLWAVPAAIAAAATLAVLSLPQLLPLPARQPDGSGLVEADRTKGLGPHLALFRRTAGGSEALEHGAAASPGDVIRVGYRAAGGAYGAIVSLDGRGTVTRHLPLSGDEAIPLASGHTVLLEQAYELDDAPRFERFYLVTSREPFSLLTVLQAVRDRAGAADATLSLPAGMAQDSFLLLKGDPR